MDQKVVSDKESSKRVVGTQNLEFLFSQRAPNPVTFVNTLIHEGIRLLASDLLLEPRKDELRVRARIDGVLYELGKISLDVYNQISSRIKILSKLDTAERRRIHEGQFSVEHEGGVVNLRIEIAQAVHGELIVIRIHEKKTIVMELSQLGFNEKAYDDYQKMLRQRGGLILISGPTGCGKTTTLYSTITKLNEDQNYNVMTIEDPVEFHLEGVNQMQASEEEGFTFAAGLRTILRLSPDIIFVGEVRDLETAKIAIESGLTGQLVLSTTHAEDSVGTLFRLLDLGIESYLLNSALLWIVAQRLVRKVCQACKVPYAPLQTELDFFKNIMGRPPKQLVRGKGCFECQNMAYKGRVGIFEVLRMNERIRGLIRGKVEEDSLRDTLVKEGFVTLIRDGLKKCEQEETTIAEILRNSLRIK